MAKEECKASTWLLVGVLSGLAAATAVRSAADALASFEFRAIAPGKGVVQAAAAPRGQSVRDHEVAMLLRSGGYLLHFRHANRQKWDSVIAFDVYEMVTGADANQASFRDAVCLSHQGIEEARMLGEVFRLAGVPVATVITSPSCRARQTAELAFGRIDATVAALAHTPVTNASNGPAFAAALRRTLTETVLPVGGNVALVAHGNTLENHPGMFAKGADLLGKPLLLETGFYVIRRHEDGSLELVHEYQSLGDFAAAAITLDSG